MPPEVQTRKSPAATGLQIRDNTSLHVQIATVDTLLQRLDGVQKSGSGWRSRCPACGGSSRKVSIAETDGRVLLHAFCGCRADDVLAAVGLCWADLMPPRTWPASPEEQRRARRAMREAGWASALSVLGLESTVVAIAARQMLIGETLNPTDFRRLVQAAERIDDARAVLNAR